MIILRDVSKSFHVGKTENPVFRNVNLALPAHRRIVLLGHRSSGKSTLIKVLAGLLVPDEGQVERLSRISFPVGYTGGFKRQLTVRSNLAFAARIYGAPVQGVIDVVDRSAKLGSLLDLDVGEIPPTIRKRVAYALAYAIRFDIYLIDNEIESSDKDFREASKSMFLERLKESGIIVATSEPSIAREYAQHAGIIADGKIKMFNEVDDAIAAFEASAPPDSRLLRKKRIQERRRERDEEAEAEAAEDQDMFG